MSNGSFFLDTYYLFKIKLIEYEDEDAIELTAGYSTHLIESIDDIFINKLIYFWEKAYNAQRKKAEDVVISSMKSGDVCNIVVYQGEIAAMCWSGDHVASRIAFSNLLKAEKFFGIGYNHFVDPVHRGKKLQRILVLELIKHAKNNGLNAYYAFVGVKNFPSLYSLQKIFNECKIVTHLEVDIPFRKFNFYPLFSKEKWSKC